MPSYIFFDAATGDFVRSLSLPAGHDEPSVPKGQIVVVPADGRGLKTPMKIDRRKCRKPVNHVASIGDVLSSWSAPEMPADARFNIARDKAIAANDQRFAARIDAVRGPLATLHAEKRKQAAVRQAHDPALMPLVADETDRLAILANAAKEDEAVAAIEAERRRIKATLKAATTEDEIRAALALDQKERLV